MESWRLRVPTLRAVVLLVGAACIAGMIVSSIADNTGAAMTFGLVAAAAVLCLIVATAVSPPTTVSEEQAARVEAMVDDLVAEGADEAAVRALVREAVRLGRRDA